jgi:hypothetical protein
VDEDALAAALDALGRDLAVLVAQHDRAPALVWRTRSAASPVALAERQLSRSGRSS